MSSSGFQQGEMQEPLKPGNSLPDENHITVRMIFLVLIAGTGGFLFGMDTSNIAGALKFIEAEFEITSAFTTALVVSGTVAGAIPGALIGGYVGEEMGRRGSLLISSIVYVIAGAMMALSQSLWILIAGRVLAGLAVGMASTTVPIYLAETATSGARGALVAMYIVLVTAGQASSYILAYFFAQLFPSDVAWRFMLGVSIIPALFMFVGMLFMPETPRWLILHEKVFEARETLRGLRGTDDVGTEITDIVETHRKQQEKANISVFSPQLRPHLTVGVGLQIFQQFVGINVIMYYSVKIVRQAGFVSGNDDILYSIPISCSNCIFTFLGLYLIDRIGRRKLLLGALVGATISLFCLALYFYVAIEQNHPIEPSMAPKNKCETYTTCWECTQDEKCGYCPSREGSGPSCHAGDIKGPLEALECPPELWTYDSCPSDVGIIAVIIVIAYLGFFASGVGPVPWAVNSEIYPLEARSQANSVATFANWTTDLLVGSFAFPVLMAILSPAITFSLYGIAGILAIIFVWRMLPETAGRSLEEIQKDLSSGQWDPLGQDDNAEKALLSS